MDMTENEMNVIRSDQITVEKRYRMRKGRTNAYVNSNERHKHGLSVRYVTYEFYY